MSLESAELGTSCLPASVGAVAEEGPLFPVAGSLRRVAAQVARERLLLSVESFLECFCCGLSSCSPFGLQETVAVDESAVWMETCGRYV